MADKKISALTAASTPLAGTEVLPIVQSGTTVKVAVSDLTAGRAIAATSLTTATVQASNSGGLALKNSGGTTQMLLGGGGGDNITLSVATNITPANAAVAISPTGTGTVTINPAAASTINNTSIGATTASTGRFTSVTLSTDNIVQGTAAKGFNFTANTPAAGMTGQLLNWYEEGTWTPEYKSQTGAFTTMTMDVLAARYTRIGRQVTVTCAIRTDNVDATGASSVVYIDGLPFTAASANAGASSAALSQVVDFTLNYPSGGYVQPGTTRIYLTYRTTSNGADTELPVAALTTGASANKNNLILTATYTV